MALDAKHTSMEGREPAIRITAMPADANPNGDIFGGYIMSLMDMAGANVAYRRARGRLATVGVKEIAFLVPVQVGDEVTCYAEIIATGRTSVTTRVETWVRARDGGSPVMVTEGEFTYVRIGGDRLSASAEIGGRCQSILRTGRTVHRRQKPVSKCLPAP